MTTRQLREQLYSLKDEQYKRFQSKLIPSINPDTMIGVRTPQLKKIAAVMVKEGKYQEFLQELPHAYFEENQIHGFIIAGIKEWKECVKEINYFLPYVDNWATCDQLNPIVFKDYRSELLLEIFGWLKAKEEYTVRFGIKMLMDHFLEEDFSLSYPTVVSQVVREEYYIRMMIAWYFATALARQYEKILPYFTERRLEKWIHNKALQKAVESNRIESKKKEDLKKLKRKGRGNFDKHSTDADQSSH